MADIQLLIPFLIYFETGVKDSNADMKTLFTRAKSKGIANDPADLGGNTLVGITSLTYSDYCRKNGRKPTPLSDLDYDKWLDILKSMFWDRWQADLIADQSVAEMLVDWVWTSGSYGITLPQKLLGVAPDGIVGRKTLSALNARNPGLLFRQLKTERIAYIERICKSRPANAKFRTGWLRRINAVGHSL